MTKYTKAIDELMWSLADRGNPQATADFERRHPSLREELARRSAMVGQLRCSKVAAPAVIPIFRPSPRPVPSLRPKWIMGGLGLAAIGIASYTITNSMFGNSPAPVQNDVPAITSATSFDTQEGVEMPGRRRLKMGIARDDESATGHRRHSGTASELPASKRPFTVHLERATLITILQAVAQQGQLKIEMPLDMVNPEIRVDYDDVSPADIIADLGKKYGFTAFDEGESNLLIIPAVDKSKGVGGFVTDSDSQDQKSNP